MRKSANKTELGLTRGISSRRWLLFILQLISHQAIGDLEGAGPLWMEDRFRPVWAQNKMESRNRSLRYHKYLAFALTSNKHTHTVPQDSVLVPNKATLRLVHRVDKSDKSLP